MKIYVLTTNKQFDELTVDLVCKYLSQIEMLTSTSSYLLLKNYGLRLIRNFKMFIVTIVYKLATLFKPFESNEHVKLILIARK